MRQLRATRTTKDANIQDIAWKQGKTNTFMHNFFTTFLRRTFKNVVTMVMYYSFLYCFNLFGAALVSCQIWSTGGSCFCAAVSVLHCNGAASVVADVATVTWVGSDGKPHTAGVSVSNVCSLSGRALGMMPIRCVLCYARVLFTI
jgi:hypothetical protein